MKAVRKQIDLMISKGRAEAPAVTRRVRMDTEQPCPNNANHTPSPAGYLAWFKWAEKMMQTHDQTICPGCGLWKLWVPKEGDSNCG